MDTLVRFKGIRDGILIAVGEGSWPQVQAALLDQVSQQASFLKGAKIALDVGAHHVRAGEMGSLRDMLSEHGLSLWAVLSSSPATNKTAQSLGLATRIASPQPGAVPPIADTSIQEGEDAILIQRTLRSGFSLHYPGHVTIIGDVNPGAEVVAGGNIVVWGKLRGMVHAGATGDESARVCALVLSPTQLRIAGEIAIPPNTRQKPQPEIASIRDGQVIAEPWQLKKR